jgi:membrane protease YdiL (CAAX protease family)
MLGGRLQIGITVAPVVGIILPIYLLTRRFKRGLRRQLLILRPTLRTGLYVMIATFFAVVIVDFIYMFSQKYMLPPVDYVEGLKELKPTGAFSTVITFVGLCVIVPIGEEIIFRGIIQRVFARNMGGVLALVLAGAFFGVIHLTPQLLLSMVAFGIYLGFLFYATSNLFYPIFAHCLLNAVGFVQLVSAPVDEASAPPFYVQNIWMLIPALIAIGYLLYQIKKGDLVKTKTPYIPPDDSDAR